MSAYSRLIVSKDACVMSKLEDGFQTQHSDDENWWSTRADDRTEGVSI